MVRSNPDNEVGFLKDWRRMNVAVTRARRMLIVVGDSDCVTADPKISTLYTWFEDNGVVTSAQEFRGYEGIRFGQGKSSYKKVDKRDTLQNREAKNQGNKISQSDKNKISQSHQNKNKEKIEKKDKNKNKHNVQG